MLSPNAAAIWAFFKSKGVSDGGTAGIIGNLQQESSLNPSEGGGGLAQWGGSRWNALSSYAAGQGTSVNDLHTQLQFIWMEMNGSAGDGENFLAQVGGLSAFNHMSPSGAAQAFSNIFERPGIPMMGNRIAYANEAYQSFAGTQQGVPSSYSSVTVYLNGKPFAAIAVNGKTYLLYTALNLFGIKYTVDYTKHTFTLSNGTVIQGVVQGGTTYIPYYQIPGIQTAKASDGHWNFTMKVAAISLGGLLVLGTLGWLGYKYLKKGSA